RARRLISTGRHQLEITRGRGPAREVDYATERAAAVQIRSRAVEDLRTLQTHTRHTVPIHPTAERAIQRCAVVHNQRAARSIRADATQRNTLRRRIRSQTPRPP